MYVYTHIYIYTVKKTDNVNSQLLPIRQWSYGDSCIWAQLYELFTVLYIINVFLVIYINYIVHIYLDIYRKRFYSSLHCIFIYIIY